MSDTEIVANLDGSVTITWKRADDAWEIGYVLQTHGRERGDKGFEDDGRGLMDAADTVARRKIEKLNS